MLHYQTISQGGPLMYLLLACSCIGVALIVERCVFWIMEERKKRTACYSNISKLSIDGKFAEALEQLAARMPEQQQIRHALEKKNLGRLSASLSLEANRLYTRGTRTLPWLETLAAISPLLGILGTVLGIIKAFQGLNLQSAAAADVIAAGLSEALFTTAFGLIIAVPALVLFNYFSGKATRYARDIFTIASEVSLHDTPLPATSVSKEEA